MSYIFLGTDYADFTDFLFFLSLVVDEWTENILYKSVKSV